jgi:DNA ligase-1
MKLPTLYKLTANQTINKWTIFAEGNCYWSEFGKINGVIQQSEKTYCVGKNKGRSNETSDEEQAVMEATAIWRKKQSMENFVTDIEAVNNIEFQPPMLAKIYNKVYMPNMKYIQPKLDGIRCNMSLKNGEIQSISRRNKPFSSTKHIEEELKEFFNAHPLIHLDGELYNHELHDNFNKIVSLVKKQKINDKDREEIESTVKYYVYDLWVDDNPNMPFTDRNTIINQFLSNLENVVIVPTFKIESSDETDAYFRKFVSDGYEGAIIRTDDPYEHKRSNNLLKYKEFVDEEFPIIDVNIGKNQTIAESVTIKLRNGNICNATLAFPDDKCKEILENKENYIGKKATVCYFGITIDGLLRFPVVKSINREEYE